MSPTSAAAAADATTGDRLIAITHRPATPAEAIAAIEALLGWSRDALGPLIGLGELIGYLDGGGPLSLTVVRLERSLDRAEAALELLPDHLDRLRDIARRGHDPHEHATAQTAHQLLDTALDRRRRHHR